MMDTSSLNDVIIRSIDRDTLWFGRYSMSARLAQSEVPCVRSLNHDKIAKTIAYRRENSRRIANQPGSWSVPLWSDWYTPRNISTETENALHHLCDLILSLKDYRVTILGNNLLQLYFNDVAIVDKLAALEYANLEEVTRIVQVTGDPNTVRLKKSNYWYRSYFRYKRLTPTQETQVSCFLSSQDDIKLSKTLESHIKFGLSSTKEHYYFDHNSTAIETMLNLIVPGIIRKTMPIVTDNK